MKKMLLATALALLITGCAQQTFTVQNKPAVAPKPSPIISSFLGGRRKTVDAAKICGGAENVKTETQQTFVNGLLRFFAYFRHLYSAGSVCAHNNL